MISISFFSASFKQSILEKCKRMEQENQFSIASNALNGQVLKIDRIEAIILKASIERPVKTSFGVMSERPSLIVEVTEQSGCIGYGEIWCNFPSFGAEYKAHLVSNEFAIALKDVEFTNPFEIYHFLQSRFEILTLQCGDRGALSQIIAGIDQAVWDCFGRLAGKSISTIFGAKGKSITAYASGIHPADVEEKVQHAIKAGYQAAKVKVGFSPELDESGVRRARELLGPKRSLMTDANQGWRSVEEASKELKILEVYNLTWIEEALPSNRKIDEWQALKSISTIRLAGGENAATLNDLTQFRDAKVFNFIQPDIGKIGGFSGLLNIFSGVIAQDVVYCPHWLGGGLGLAASAHLLNIIGGDGCLEVDVNDNPLRDEMGDWKPELDQNGEVEVPKKAGIGLTPDYVHLEQMGINITRL